MVSLLQYRNELNKITGLPEPWLEARLKQMRDDGLIPRYTKDLTYHQRLLILIGIMATENHTDTPSAVRSFMEFLCYQFAPLPERDAAPFQIFFQVNLMSALTLALQAPFRLVDLEISATRQIAKVTIYIQDSSGRDEDSCTVWYATAESSPRMNDEFPIGRETVYRMNGSTIRTLLNAGASIHMLSSDTGGEYTRISAGASSEEKPVASALASGRQDASKPIDDPFAGEQSRNVASDRLPLNGDSSA